MTWCFNSELLIAFMANASVILILKSVYYSLFLPRQCSIVLVTVVCFEFGDPWAGNFLIEIVQDCVFRGERGENTTRQFLEYEMLFSLRSASHEGSAFKAGTQGVGALNHFKCARY